MVKRRHSHNQEKYWPTRVLDYPSFERLVGDVIHKIKNNLGGISGFTTLLSRDVGEKSPHLRLLEQIQSSVVRLDELAVDLMVFIRKVNPVREKVQVKPLLNNLILQYEERNQLKCSVQYSAASEQDHFFMNSDAYILERIFRYIFRFVEYIGACLQKIAFKEPGPDKTIIQVSIQNLDIHLSEVDDIMKILSDSEPVEARLTFAIIVKLVESLNGFVSVYYHSNKCLELMIEIA